MARPSFGVNEPAAQRRLRRQPCPLIPRLPPLLVAVVGTGSMGRGIMQVAAQGGMRVLAFDEKLGLPRQRRRISPR